VKLTDLEYVVYLLKDKVIIRTVFGSYSHFVEMVEHLNNAILICNSCLMNKNFHGVQAA